MNGAPLSPAASPTQPLVFFDGTCGFCDLTVTWLFKRDARHVLRFAPLQGEAARRYLNEHQRSALETMVYLEQGRVYERSSAALRAVAAIGGLWGCTARLALLVPRPLRDAVYAVVARYRYQIFGRKDSCRLPTPAERAFFLD